MTVTGPAEAQPADGLAIDFVVESDRAQLGEIVQRVRDGRLRTNIGNVADLDDAVAALNPTERRQGEDDHPRSSVRTRHTPGRTINEGTTPMTDPTEPTRYAFEYPDEAGYPDGKGTLSQDQAVLIDEVIDDPHAPAFDFTSSTTRRPASTRPSSATRRSPA